MYSTWSNGTYLKPGGESMYEGGVKFERLGRYVGGKVLVQSTEY